MNLKQIYIGSDPLNDLSELKFEFDNQYRMSLVIRPGMTALQLAAELNSMAHHLFERLAKETSAIKEENDD